MADEKQGRVLSEYVVGEMVDAHYHRHSDEKDAPEHPRLTRATVFVPVMVAADRQPKVFKAPSGVKAIEQHTGRGKDAKLGTFKAIAWSSWKGSVTVERVVQDQRSLLEDE